jgi:hypothetical protein
MNRNPLYHLRVTAPTQARAKAQGQRFGRVVSVERIDEDHWDVLVDQRRRAPNPSDEERLIDLKRTARFLYDRITYEPHLASGRDYDYLASVEQEIEEIERKLEMRSKRRRGLRPNSSKPDVRAWSGGSAPPQKLPPDVARLAEKLYDEQVKTWRDYWGDEPDADVQETFRKRARYDAWATLRHKHEGKSSTKRHGKKKNQDTAAAKRRCMR